MACGWSWPMPACCRPSRSSRFPPHAALGGVVLLGAAAVGLATGLGAWLMTQAVYRFEDAFHLLTGRLHWMWWPMIGGLIIGLGGLVEPRALGVGYGTIHAELLGQLGLSALALLFVVKLLIWSAGLGSGTSGGILAPVLMLGAAIGGILGHALPGTTPGVWALIGLAGAMGGVTRSPFTAIIFAFELTHDQNSLLALLVAATISHLVSVLILKRSILTEKVARRGFHVMREYSVDPLEATFVREVMDTDVVTVTPEQAVGKIYAALPEGSPAAPAAALSRARRGHRARRAPALVGHPRGTGPLRPAAWERSCCLPWPWPIPTRSCAPWPTAWCSTDSGCCRSSSGPTPPGWSAWSRSSTSCRPARSSWRRSATPNASSRCAAPRRTAARPAGRGELSSGARHHRLRPGRGGGLGGPARVRPPPARSPPPAVAGASLGPHGGRRQERIGSPLRCRDCDEEPDQASARRCRLLGAPGRLPVAA